MQNWAGNVEFSADRIHRPTTTDELRRLVAAAPRLRPFGTTHSFNRIADSTDEMVAVTAIPPDIRIDAAAGTVSTGGGIRYGELAVALDRSGWALHNMASLPHISVAGAIATGTHGSGNALGGLGTAVRALEMVTASGDLVTLRQGEPDFDGAVVALGGLGVVTRVTLAIEPSYQVRQYVYDDMPLAEFDPDVFAAARSVSVLTDWTGDSLTRVWLKHAGEAPPDVPARWRGARLADGPRHPISGADPSLATPQLGEPGPWHERMPHFRLGFTPSAGDELQTEYLIDRGDAMAALRALHAIQDLFAPVLAISELRTVAADAHWLSPAYRRDSLAVHFTWKPDGEAVAAVLPAIEECLEPFAPRPHWGKVFAMAPGAVAGRYPRHTDFGALRKAYDPDGKFGNAFMDAFAPLG